MSIDPNKWLSFQFTSTTTPAWPCPTCNDGILVPVDRTFRQETDASSRNALNRKDDGYDPLNTTGVFLGLLRCNQKACAEPVAVSGKVTVEEFVDENDRQFFGDGFDPHFFFPAPPIFKTPTKCAGSLIEVELKKAWSAYWADPDACANHIRSCVEALMNHLKVPRKQKTKKGGFMPLKLHHRILLFQKEEPELGDDLIAIKWLGNSGSHAGESLTRHDILQGLPLLEHVLGEIFDRRTAERAKLRRALLKKWRPRRRSPGAAGGSP